MVDVESYQINSPEKKKKYILNYIYARNGCINRTIFYWWRKKNIEKFDINDDREFVLKLCKMKVHIIDFISDRLKNDKEFMIEVKKYIN